MAGSMDTEELFKVMQETHKIKEEVSMIKSCLERHEYKKDDDEILIRLQLTRLSSLAPCVEVIKATEVEKAVRIFKNHSSKTIRDHVQSLMNEWKNLKEEWQKFTGQSLADVYGTDDEDSQRGAENLKTKKQSHGVVGKEMRVLNEEVHKPEDLSFKGPRIILQLRSNKKVCIPIRKEAPENITTKKAIVTTEKPEAAKNITTKKAIAMTEKPEAAKNITTKKAIVMTEKPEAAKNITTKKAMMSEKPGANRNITTKKAMMTEKPHEATTCSVDLKFKSTQKRLHESYKQAENAKKQRRIQVIDYQPKERSCHAKKNHTTTHVKSFRPHLISQH